MIFPTRFHRSTFKSALLQCAAGLLLLALAMPARIAAAQSVADDEGSSTAIIHPALPPSQPAPQPGWVLLANKPELYDAPARSASHVDTSWSAGRRLTVLESRAADPDTSPSVAWFRVAAGPRRTGVRGDRATSSSAPTATGWLPEVYLSAPPPPVAPPSTGSIGHEVVDRAHGLPPEYAPDDLVSVGPRYDKDVDYQMRREAAAALRKMVAAARADHVTLQVVSAYRPWARQQELYESRLRASGWMQQTVAPPGHSEHQLGTAADLTDGDEATLVEPSFGNSAAGRWLRANAPRFGFAVSYTRHNAPQTGYAPEPWHYRYWGPEEASARQRAALGEE